MNYWATVKSSFIRIFSIDTDHEHDEDLNIELTAPSKIFTLKTTIELSSFEEDTHLAPSWSGSFRSGRIFRRAVRKLIRIMRKDRIRVRIERDQLIHDFMSGVGNFDVKNLSDEESGFSFPEEKRNNGERARSASKEGKQMTIKAGSPDTNFGTEKHSLTRKLTNTAATENWGEANDLDLDNDPLKPKHYNPLEFPKKKFLPWISYILMFPINMVYFYFFPNILSNASQKKLVQSGSLLVVFSIILTFILASIQDSLMIRYQVKPQIFAVCNSVVFSFK